MYAAVVNTFDAPPRYTTFADPVPAEGKKLFASVPPVCTRS